MKKVTIFLVAIGCILMLSCEPNTYSEIEQPVATPTPTTTATPTPTSVNKTYTTDIKPIVTTNCTSCHSSGGQSPVLTTYTQVKNAASTGKLLCTIQALNCKIMPPGGKMSQANIDLILLWKTQGYLQ